MEDLKTRGCYACEYCEEVASGEATYCFVLGHDKGERVRAWDATVVAPRCEHYLPYDHNPPCNCGGSMVVEVVGDDLRAASP